MSTTSQRIRRLKKLAKYYFTLEKGELIEKPFELLHVFGNVYISRKALKHFVERRKEEFCKNHTEHESLEKILFIISEISRVILHFDSLRQEQTEQGIKYFYSKNYTIAPYFPPIRIVLYARKSRFEISSLHLRTNDK